VWVAFLGSTGLQLFVLRQQNAAVLVGKSTMTARRHIRE
jgi:hypothetical protein